MRAHMRWIGFFVSFGILAQSADFMFVPRVRPRLEEIEYLRAPPEKKLVTGYEEDFLHLLFHRLFSTIDEYLREMERLEALQELGKWLDAKQRFFLQILTTYLEIVNPQQPNKLNFKQTNQEYVIPVLVCPGEHALVMSAANVASSSLTGMSADFLDSLNTSEPFRGTSRFTQLFHRALNPLVANATGSELNDLFNLRIQPQDPVEKYLFNIVYQCQFTPVTILGALVLLDRFLSNNPDYRLVRTNAPCIAAISLLVAAKSLEKSLFSVEVFVQASRIHGKEINPLILAFCFGASFDLYLPPTWVRQLFKSIFQGQNEDVLRLLREHRGSRLRCVQPPEATDWSSFKPLAKGAYGDVRVSLSSGVVLKLLGSWFEMGKFADSSVLAELICGGVLDHPNLMKIDQVCCYFGSVNHPRLGLLMPYCSGGDLYNYIRNNKLEIGRIKKLIYQLLSVLEYLCEKEISHGDIKSKNIFVNEQGDLVLGDFGLARVNEHAVIGSEVTQTVNYRSPEIFCQDSQVSCPQDIWAAACVLAEMVCRNFLFPTNKFQNTEEIESAVLVEIRALLGNFHLPQKLASQVSWFLATRTISFNPAEIHQKLREQLGEAGYDLFLRMLMIDPEKRITAADALNHEFFHQQAASLPSS